MKRKSVDLAGRKWMTRRRILTPGFHFNTLQQFVGIFNEETDKLVEIFKTLCDQPFISINPHITQFTLKTIAGNSFLRVDIVCIFWLKKPQWGPN
jgi:cytochrome P450